MRLKTLLLNALLIDEISESKDNLSLFKKFIFKNGVNSTNQWGRLKTLLLWGMTKCLMTL